MWGLVAPNTRHQVEGARWHVPLYVEHAGAPSRRGAAQPRRSYQTPRSCRISTIRTSKFDRISIGSTRRRACSCDNGTCNRMKIKCQGIAHRFVAATGRFQANLGVNEIPVPFPTPARTAPFAPNL